MIEKRNFLEQNSPKDDIKLIDIWILEKVTQEIEALKQKNKITVDNFRKSVSEMKEAQDIILKAIIGDDEARIEWDYHTLESELTPENKYLLREILPSIGILYIYQNHNNDEAIKTGINILSPENKDTGNCILKIKMRRRGKNNPFFINKIDIISN